ncbi:MAG: hypothetical protein QOD83_5064 [Solirubrobacteraceae bacterium]|jgi:hypothetical protein|nr:hypothetical protein [Solirubrobacteraceae bacterium]
MTDPVLAFLVLVVFIAAAAATRFFRTLDANLWRAVSTPLGTGVAAGVIVSLLDERWEVAAIGILLTIAALYVRLTGDESDAIDGMLLGACTGAAAAAPLILFRGATIRPVAECFLAGSVAGFGITFAAFHVADRLRQMLFDLVTAAAAIGAAYTAEFLAARGVNDRQIVIAAASLAPLLVVVAVFVQWVTLRNELTHEASLGFVDVVDVRTTAHPLLRFGRGGWTDARAHREFVRLANRIALRKRQQRGRSEEVARLYQLEIIKLRMQIQEMSRIDHATRARNAEPDDDTPASDTIARSK